MPQNFLDNCFSRLSMLRGVEKIGSKFRKPKSILISKNYYWARNSRVVPLILMNVSAQTAWYTLCELNKLIYELVFVLLPLRFSTNRKFLLNYDRVNKRKSKQFSRFTRKRFYSKRKIITGMVNIKVSYQRNVFKMKCILQWILIKSSQGNNNAINV